MSRNTTILSAVNADATALLNVNKLTATSSGIVTGAADILAAVNHYYAQRNAAGEMSFQYGPFGIHALLDAAGPASRKIIVWEDMVQLHRVAGTAMQACLGWVDNVTVNDFTTKTGIGFYFDAAGTATWHCFIIEAATGFVAPYTTLIDTDTGLAALSSDPTAVNIRRLCLVLDGRHRRVRWYIDGVLREEYTYATTPARLAGALGTFLRYRLYVPAATTSRIRHLWGSTYEHIRVYDDMD